MLDLIVRVAREDLRVRAVILSGSRADPNAPRDCFQDFDVVYIVTDVGSFLSDRGFVSGFGELIIMQTPDLMGDHPAAPGESFAYLMQFADGNRIDLTLSPVERLADLEHDSLRVLLLDKDGIIGRLPPPNEAGYLPEPPTAKQFSDCCN